jgi:hypothetical protein
MGNGPIHFDALSTGIAKANALNRCRYRTRVRLARMSTPFEIPDWLVEQSDPPLPPVDDHRVEGLVNGFIAGKQDALFAAPDAYYRNQGRDALDGAPAIVQRLQDLRNTTLDQARDDGERAALAPRLAAHLDDAMDGIGRHVAAQRLVFQRNTLGTRQALIRRAAKLEHDNDDKIAGLAEAHASAAQALARLSGVEPGSDDEADVLNAARSQILRTAIEQRIANARSAQAIDLHDRMNDALTPADRSALEVPIAATRDDTATDAWLARQAGIDGPPLADRVDRDDTLPDTQRLILRAKIGARDSAAESSRVATVKGLDDQLAAATQAIATQPSTVPDRHPQRIGQGLRGCRRPRAGRQHAPAGIAGIDPAPVRPDRRRQPATRARRDERPRAHDGRGDHEPSGGGVRQRPVCRRHRALSRRWTGAAGGGCRGAAQADAHDRDDAGTPLFSRCGSSSGG